MTRSAAGGESQPRRILVINRDAPPADRDAGSLRLFRVVELMLAEGHEVTVLGQDGVVHAGAVEALHALGVEQVIPLDVERALAVGQPVAPALSAFWPADGLAGLLRRGRFDIAWISFYQIAERYLPIVRGLSPGTRIVVDSVDVHWVRERRGAALTGDAGAALESERTRLREQAVYAAADANVAVTDTDAVQLRELAPEIPVHVIPTIHPVSATASSPAGRAGCLFVGNFDHHPNVDAVHWFHAACWPAIRATLPDMRLTVAGAFPPESIRALAGDDVRVTGWVPSLEPYMASARVSVAPLRYGAGMKGKIGEAIAAGLPVVTTPVGAEGMGLEHEQHALVVDNAQSFAAAVVRLAQDDALWTRLAANAQALLSRAAGSDAARSTLAAAIATLTPERWQAPADATWLDQLLRAYAEAYVAGANALLVLTVPPGTPDAATAAVRRVTECTERLGIDLDAIADIEITGWRDDLPSPARTLFWSAGERSAG